MREKVERIAKTMNICTKNGITFWKKYFILMTYGLPYISYGSNASNCCNGPNVIKN